MIEVEDKDPVRFGALSIRDHGPGVISVSIAACGESLHFHKDTWPALKAAIEATIKELEKPKEVTIRLHAVRESEPFMLGGQRYSLLSTTEDPEGYLKVDARSHTLYVSKLFRNEQVTVIR